MFSLLLLTISNGCEKLCQDAELGLARTDNSTDSLRLDGYYYGDISGVNPNTAEVRLLYANGVFYNNLSFDLNDAVSGNVVLINNDLRKEYKGDWGVYKITGNSIEIRSWFSRANGCVGRYIEKGVILSDTTFKITSWQSSRDDKEVIVDATFNFVPFSPKSDSIVSFLP